MYDPKKVAVRKEKKNSKKVALLERWWPSERENERKFRAMIPQRTLFPLCFLRHWSLLSLSPSPLQALLRIRTSWRSPRFRTWLVWLRPLARAGRRTRQRQTPTKTPKQTRPKWRSSPPSQSSSWVREMKDGAETLRRARRELLLLIVRRD